MSAINLDEAEEHTCLNCGTTFRGDYCPHCRQKASTKRLSTSDSVKNIVSKFVTLDSGLLHTIINLIYRPGYMVRDYLKGHRVEYVEPMMLLFLLLAIDYLFPDTESDTALTFPERWAVLKGDYPFAHQLLSAWYWMFSDMQRSIVVVCIMMSPAVTLSLKLLRLKEKALNLSESFHVLLYALCYYGVMIVVLDTIDLIVSVPKGGDYFVLGMMFLVFFAIVRTCTDMSWLKLALFVVIFPIIFFILLLLYLLLFMLVLHLSLPKEVYDTINLMHF